MTIPSASSSRPADTSFVVAATLVACTLFLVGWGVLHRGFFTHDRIIDTPVYESYGSAIDSGHVPYRDFALEYPPGALPVFALPALGGAHGDTFRRRFELEMAFLGEVIVICLAVALFALSAGRRRVLAVLGFAALAVVALGPVVLSRFDLWPAALTAAALAALVSGRLRLGHLAAVRDGPERIEVADDHVDRLDALLLERPHVLGPVAAGQDAGVDRRVQRLHAAAQHLGGAGQILDARERDVGLGQRRGRARGRHQLDPQLVQPAGERLQPGLVADRHKRSLDPHTGSFTRTRRPSTWRRPAANSRTASGSNRCSISCIRPRTSSGGSSYETVRASCSTIGPESAVT